MDDNYDIFEDDDEGSKIGRYEISSYNLDKPIETLIKWKKNGKLIVPDFQRDFVWKFTVACRLIDSILLNLPIPGIFVCRRILNGEEKFYLIDGLQRITTLEQFKDGQFISNELNVNKNFKIALKNSDWYNFSFDDLSDNDKENFLDYSISLTVFEISEKNEDKNLNCMFEIFERINTGSEKLTNQEIRNAIYPGIFLDRIKQYCSSNESYKLLLSSCDKFSKRKKDEELYLRFITYYFVYLKYLNNENYFFDGSQSLSSSKIETLNLFLYYSNKQNINFEKYETLVDKAIEIIKDFNVTSFYALKRDGTGIGTSVHEVFAEALVIAVIENDFKIEIPSDKFDDWKIKNWNTNYFKPFVESTTNRNSIIERVNILKKVISNGNC